MIKNNNNNIKTLKKGNSAVQQKQKLSILEKNIVEKVYRFEKRKTIADILKYFFSFTFLLFASFYLVSIIRNILITQQTLDLFDLFKEDMEIIKDFLPDVLYTFYLEMPKELTFFLIVSIILLLVTVIFIFKNFGKIKKRYKAISRHFK